MNVISSKRQRGYPEHRGCKNRTDTTTHNNDRHETGNLAPAAPRRVIRFFFFSSWLLFHFSLMATNYSHSYYTSIDNSIKYINKNHWRCAGRSCNKILMLSTYVENKLTKQLFSYAFTLLALLWSWCVAYLKKIIDDKKLFGQPTVLRANSLDSQLFGQPTFWEPTLWTANYLDSQLFGQPTVWTANCLNSQLFGQPTVFYSFHLKWS